jgi:hypothetical protein
MDVDRENRQSTIKFLAARVIVFLSGFDPLADEEEGRIRVGIHSPWRTVPTLHTAEYTSDRAFLNVLLHNSIRAQTSEPALHYNNTCNFIAILFVNGVNDLQDLYAMIYAIFCTDS